MPDKVFVYGTLMKGHGNHGYYLSQSESLGKGEIFDYPFLYENYIDLATEYMQFNNRNRMISLKDAIEETGVEKRGILHAAYDDAVNAALVLQKVMSMGWTNDRSRLSVAM